MGSAVRVVAEVAGTSQVSRSPGRNRVPARAGPSFSVTWPLLDQPVHLGAAQLGDLLGKILVEARRRYRDDVNLGIAQARRAWAPRQSPPSTRIVTPTLIEESATLKIGQCGTWIKSTTEPLIRRS